MPLVNILGFTVFIPDLTDLANFIVAPIQNFISAAFSLGSTIVNGISYVILNGVSALFSAGGAIINAIISGVTAGFGVISSAVIAGVTGLINGIVSTASSIYAYLSSTVGPAISSVFAAVSAVAGQVISYITGGLTAVISGITALPGLITGGFSQLSAFMSHVGQDIINAGAATGQALLMSFQGGLDSAAKALGGLPGELWNGLKTFILDPAGRAFATFINGIQGLLNGIFTGIQGALFSAGPGAVNDPLGFAARIIGSILGIGATIAIPMAAAELVHPLKQLGLNQLSAYFWDLADFRSVGGTIMSTITAVSVASFLRQGLNQIYRPSLPPLTQADQMFFEGYISAEQWNEIYRLWGWQDRHIQAWFGTMFTEPSDRLLLDMVGVPGIPEAWSQKKWRERGYNPEDVAIMGLYSLHKKIQDEVALARSALTSAYVDGVISRSVLLTELQGLGLSKPEVDWTVYAADRRYERALQLEKVKAINAAFQNNLMTETEMRSQLQSVLQDPDRAKAIAELQVYKKRPSREPRADTTKKLTAAQLQRAYVEDVITEAQLTRALQDLNYNPDSVAVLVTEAKQKKLGAGA